MTHCSLVLKATSQQYCNQPAVLFSQNIPALAINHQPNEQAIGFGLLVCSSAPESSIMQGDGEVLWKDREVVADDLVPRMSCV
jgi:hypothetical protein